MATRKTDPTKKKKVNGKKTNGKKSTTKKKTTAAQRNAARRKKYLDKAYKSGLDTTNVKIKGGRGRIQSVGASKRKVKGRTSTTITGHYKTTKGKTARLPTTSDKFRQVSRGYKVEKTGSKKKKK